MSAGRSAASQRRACAPSGLSRDASQAEPLVPNACGCGGAPNLYTAAGEFRLKCSCGVEGAWAIHSLGALRAWNKSVDPYALGGGK